MAKLKIEIDTAANKLTLGGLGIAKVVKDGKIIEINVIRVLGMYKEFVEGFNINSKELEVIPNESVVPGKITIDGYDIAKESYRVFISRLDDDYEYELKSYLLKPKVGEEADIIDMKAMEHPKLANKANRSFPVIMGEFNKKRRAYSAFLNDGYELFLRRGQFLLKNNRIDIAFLKDINS